MTPAHLPRARFEKLVDRLRQLPEAQRERILEERFTDPELRADILHLINEGLDFQKPMERSVVNTVELLRGAEGEIVPIEAEEPVDEDPAATPERIGPYRITGLLGEGGMGSVYLAEQTFPVKRRLAVKIIRSSFPGKKLAARFEAEQQAMARLSHPNIAQMYEAGTTIEGHPFFAMEFVDGPSVTEFCDRQRLGIEERLRVFLAICRGVNHAHQRGILHRDLKPSNILVSRDEGEPVPKIIDFGIAKALDGRLTEHTLQLTAQGLMGTPHYMSPESFRVSEDSVDPDTRSDVYALGVLLYEMLCGQPPFQGDLGSVVYQICNNEPLRPSRRLEQAKFEVEKTVAENRRLTPPALARRLRGDLDWIVIKAIAKDREQRYGSVAHLAVEIERHLDHQPVSATPPSVSYRISKWVRRHRVAAVAAGIAILSLVVGIAGLSLGLVQARSAEVEARAQAQRAIEAESRASLEARSSRQVADFLVELFEVSDPEKSPGHDITARQLLDRAAARIRQKLDDQPALRARLMATLGRVYAQLGVLDESESLHLESLDLLREHLGETHPQVAEAMTGLGHLYREQGRLDEAEAMLTEAIDRQEDVFGSDSARQLAALTNLGSVYTDRGDFPAAERALLKARDLAESELGPRHPTTLHVLSELARGYGYQDKPEAVELLERILLAQRDILPPDDPSLAQTLNHLALAAARRDDPTLAADLLRQSLEIAEAALGPAHPTVSKGLSNLGYNLFRAGRYREALEPLERAVAIDERTGLGDHPYAASRLTNLGLVYWKLGRFREAEPLFKRAQEIRERVLAPGHAHRATSLWGLANVYRDQGKLKEAEPLYLEALRLRQNALPPGHPELVDAQSEYAVLLRMTGRGGEAKALEAQIAEAGGAELLEKIKRASNASPSRPDSPPPRTPENQTPGSGRR